MIIDGLLISKDNEHAVIRQSFTGYTYVVQLKDLQVEKRNGKIVKYDGKPSVRITGYPFCKCEWATEIKKVGSTLVWKTHKKDFHCNLQEFEMEFEILNEKLERFFNNEGFNVRVRYGDRFCYDFRTATVYYTDKLPAFAAKLQMMWAMKHGLEYTCSPFFMGLLHEVGHHLTSRHLSLEEMLYCKRVKNLLDSDTVENNLAYFELPDEKIATLWAINYINNNRGKLFKLAAEINISLESNSIWS